MVTSVPVRGPSTGGQFREAAQVVARALREGEFAIAAVRGELPDSCLFFDVPKLVASMEVNKISVKQITTWMWENKHLRCFRRESLFVWGGPDVETGLLTVGVGTSLDYNPRVAGRAARLYRERAVFL